VDGTTQLVLRALHLIGVIAWIGGAATAALVVVFAANDARREASAAARRAVLWIATPGMVLAWVAGLTVLLHGWSAVYSKAGWMHGKVTVALIAAALTGVLTGRLRKAASGDKPASEGLLRGVGIGLLALAVVVAFLALLKPGG